MKLYYCFLIVHLFLFYTSHSAETTNPDNSTTTDNSTVVEPTTTDENVCQRSCTALTQVTCTLCYNTCKNSSQAIVSFNLSTCQLTKCKKWISEPRSDATPTDTVTKCSEEEVQDLSNQQCASQCCASQFTQFTYDNTNQCIQSDQSKTSSNNNVSVIIASVLSSVFFIIVVLFIVICCKSRIALCCKNLGWEIQKMFTTGQNKNYPSDSTKQTNNHQSEEPSSPTKFKRQWTAYHRKKQVSELPTSKYIIESQYEINPQIYCPICLDTDLNTQTACGHSIHLMCMRKHLNKHFTCPQCQSHKFNPLKVVCQNCQQKQTKFQITKKNLEGKTIDFLINKKIYCNKCMADCIKSGYIKSSQI